MSCPFAPYTCQFSFSERKHLIAEALKKYRKENEYSQKELAKLLGISQARYSGYEVGRTEIPAELLVRLSYLYNTSIDTLMQRNRQFKCLEDAEAVIEECQNQITELKTQQEEQ